MAWWIILTAGLAITLVTVVVIILAYRRFLPLLSTKLDTLGFRTWANAAEVLLAGALTVVAGIFSLWAKASWITKSEEGNYEAAFGLFEMVGLWLWVVVLSLYFVLKGLNYHAKEKNAADVADLKLQLQGAKRQRTRIWEVMGTISEIVNGKIKRFRLLQASGQPITTEALAAAIDPPGQIRYILLCLHGHYERALDQGKTLRLGVYVTDKDGKSMTIEFSWNGKDEECFSKQWGEYMKIADPRGAKSLIMELYHDHKTNIRVIPDCEAAAKDGHFHYFRPEQKDYIKSMVAMKKINASGDQCIILTLDTNAPGFFSDADKEDIELCCSEILRRLEFELLLSSIVIDGHFQLSNQTAPQTAMNNQA